MRGAVLALLFLLGVSWAGNLVRCIDRTAKALDLDPLLLVAIYRVESGFNPLAVGVKKGNEVRSFFPKTKREALYLARLYQDKGYSVDVGLGQINHRNLERYGISLDLAFDPCVNVYLSGLVLADCMRAYGRTLRALDCYNKGRRARSNSRYVRRVLREYLRLLRGD